MHWRRSEASCDWQLSHLTPPRLNPAVLCADFGALALVAKQWNSARLKNIFLYIPLRYIVEFITLTHTNLFLTTVCLNMCWHFSSSSIVLFWKKFIVIVPREKTNSVETSFEFPTKYLLIYEPYTHMYIYILFTDFSPQIFAKMVSCTSMMSFWLGTETKKCDHYFICALVTVGIFFSDVFWNIQTNLVLKESQHKKKIREDSLLCKDGEGLQFGQIYDDMLRNPFWNSDKFIFQFAERKIWIWANTFWN